MKHEVALANLKTGDDLLIIQALVYLGTNGTIHDVNTIAPLFQYQKNDIRVTARSTAATIIRNSMLDNYSELPKASRKKLGTLLKKLAPDLVYEITHDLQGTEEKHRINAIQILHHIGYDPAVKNLITSLLKSPDHKIRATATRVLGSVLEKNEHRFFQDLLNDPDYRVRANAIESAEQLKDEGLIYLIMRFKADPNNRIRANALKALYSLGRKKVVFEITQMLFEKDSAMVISGLWVIQSLHLITLEIIEKCALFLKGNNLQIAAIAKKTLEHMNSPVAKQYL